MPVPRLLLADRVKGAAGQLPAAAAACAAAPLRRAFRLGPAGARHWRRQSHDADIVWLEWCWDHAVWATTSGVLAGRPCILRLHSIEVLQTDFPARVDWTQVHRLILVGGDIAGLLADRFPAIAAAVPMVADRQRHRPRAVRAAASLSASASAGSAMWSRRRTRHCCCRSPTACGNWILRYTFHAAGAFTDLRTLRYLERQIPALGLGGAVRFDGPVADMPGLVCRQGRVALDQPVRELRHGDRRGDGGRRLPGRAWLPRRRTIMAEECLFAAIDEAVALIRAGASRAVSRLGRGPLWPGSAGGGGAAAVAGDRVMPRRRCSRR